MQSITPPPTIQNTSGERINNSHTLILRQYRVFNILIKQLLRLDSIHNVGCPRSTGIGRFLKQTLHAQRLLAILVPAFVQDAIFVLEIDRVVDVFLQILRQSLGRAVFVGRRRDLLGDDEGSARLVDQHGVGLVDDAESVELAGVPGQHRLLRTERQMIPQVVESQFRVGDVDHIGIVRRATLVLLHTGLDQTHLEPKVTMHLSHLLHIATGQIIIDGNHEGRLARQGIDVRGQGRNQGLSLSRSHLRQTSIVQNQSTHELDIVVTLFDHTPRRLANERERLFQNGTVDILSVRETLAKLRRLGEHFFVAVFLYRRFEAVYAFHSRLERGEVTFVGLATGFVISPGHEFFHKSHGERRGGR
mmetsp:Transcript_23122/g.48779  ORF Transcript_23122/g.48779 Transcript_23122/m.48779 type:complete len:361 (-) Transcript_23122:311-1393(-)